MVSNNKNCLLPRHIKKIKDAATKETDRMQRGHGSNHAEGQKNRNNNRFLSLLYRVSRAGTETAVALWYNTARVPTVTHDNVLDSGYTKKEVEQFFTIYTIY